MSDDEFIITFGKYKGLTLMQIVDTYEHRGVEYLIFITKEPVLYDSVYQEIKNFLIQLIE